MGLNAEPLLAHLRRFAFASVHAFPILGWGGAELWRRFRKLQAVDVSYGPHGADLFVFAGEIPVEWEEHTRSLFETVPLPRLAIWLRPDWRCEVPTGIPIAYVIESGAFHRLNWTDIRTRLLDPDNGVNKPLLADRPPAPWRGLGDHSQGGEGMMGGKPYGRPMAMTADDIDDLSLDDVPMALGPHFPNLPSGLELELRVQGDRIRTVEAVRNHFPVVNIDANGSLQTKVGIVNWLTLAALRGEPVRIADLERARVCSHLAWMADFLALSGRDSVARRFRHAFDDALVAARVGDIAKLIRRAEWGGLQQQLRGVGVTDAKEAARLNLTGPVARASGLARDGRAKDPAYQALDFAIQTETAGDSWARWRVRARECVQSMELIRRAGETLSEAPPEGPRGESSKNADGLRTPTTANLAALKAHLFTLEWFEALLFIASLDLDMQEAALR
ncbi:MAG: hypothetical protein H0V62_08275 [Gammaproteobacteria bacterium]|nr:hypothetical protein [Gammaproteobacteria bacterium]